MLAFADTMLTINASSRPNTSNLQKVDRTVEFNWSSILKPTSTHTSMAAKRVLTSRLGAAGLQWCVYSVSTESYSLYSSTLGTVTAITPPLTSRRHAHSPRCRQKYFICMLDICSRLRIAALLQHPGHWNEPTALFKFASLFATFHPSPTRSTGLHLAQRKN